MEFWNVRQDKSMGHVDLTTADASLATSSSSSSSPTTTSAISRTSSKRFKTSASSRWISSICALDANWFSVAGGGGGKGNTGFLATYHQPTRSLVAFTETRETPQQLTLLPAGNEASIPYNLISVANEGIVSHYNALSLESTRKQWLSPPSAYAAAVSNDKQFTAIGGVGNFVDIFDAAGEKSRRLSIC